MLVDVVAWEQRRRVDVETQQITNGVLILGAIEPMERFGSSRIRMGNRKSIDLGFEPSGKRFVGVMRWARSTGRRHGPGAQLGDDLLPYLGVLPDRGRVETLECEVGRSDAVAVAGEAVARQGCLEQLNPGRCLGPNSVGARRG